MLLAAAAWPVAAEHAQDPGAGEGARVRLESEPPTGLADDPEREAARRAIDRGLAWLARAQESEPDGAFPGTGARDFAPVAVTALGALAYMAGGSSPERGPHGRELAVAIDWLLARTVLDEASERSGFIAAEGDSWSRMHGHGYATLALAQAYAVSPRTERGARIATALRASVKRIESSQGFEGGWYYEPVRTAEHEGSVTICLVQALRAAHNAGIGVETSVIAKAIDYVGRLQNEDGSFRYALGIERSSVALTAAAISTLNATGTYGGKEIAEGYDFLFRELAARADTPPARSRVQREGAEPSYPYYERLYLAQALWQNADPDVFERWARDERRRMLADQGADGSWKDERWGDCYATASNCLVLALPEGLLPIFQR